MPTEKPSRLDRQLQLKLLQLMRDYYPSAWRQVPTDIAANDEDFFFNIIYLEEHGLCKTNITKSGKGQFVWGNATITAKGIDFLEDDGGLSAILGVVTVKLEADTVKRLIEAKIDEAELPADEKIKWKSLSAVSPRRPSELRHRIWFNRPSSRTKHHRNASWITLRPTKIAWRGAIAGGIQRNIT
jgi:hypothetical protein